MTKHCKVYMSYFDLGEQDFIPCEACGSESVDIHHINGRSSKDKDDIKNIMALCREHHEMVDSYQYSRDKTDHSEQMLCWIAQTIIAGYEAGVLGVRK